MPSLFCWGDRLLPHCVLEKTNTHATVEIDGQSHNIPLGKILGWCEWPYQKGDRVTVLMGSNWHSGTVGEGLSVALDNGMACPIWSANNVRSLYMPPEVELDPKLIDIAEPVPMPMLEDGLAEEFAHALEIVELVPLQVGDRVRVVLAGKPLEHLAGLLGTVDGAETFGLIPVKVDGHGAKILRREQLDLVESPRVGTLDLGAKVRHQKYWPRTVGIIAGLGDHWGKAIAWVQYPNAPLYPADLQKLIVV